MITQSEIDSVHWYHEFDFGKGLHATSKTPDVQAHRKVCDAIDFLGKSVLDIGCWDGFWSFYAEFWSFYAEKRGASSVFATDDISQNWSTGKGIHLAKALLGSKIEIDQNISIYDLAKLERKFDVILCLGVYYHLVDPFAAFAQIRHCCTNDSIIVFEGDATIGIRPDTVFQGFRDPGASLTSPRLTH
jgi:tRNA (mo5U34)-methyltransferase